MTEHEPERDPDILRAALHWLRAHYACADTVPPETRAATKPFVLATLDDLLGPTPVCPWEASTAFAQKWRQKHSLAYAASLGEKKKPSRRKPVLQLAAGTDFSLVSTAVDAIDAAVRSSMSFPAKSKLPPNERVAAFLQDVLEDNHGVKLNRQQCEMLANGALAVFRES